MTEPYDPEYLEAGPKRMSAIRLHELRTNASYALSQPQIYSASQWNAASAVAECIREIDALSLESDRHLVAAKSARDEIARLTALSTPSLVEDTGVENAIAYLSELRPTRAREWAKVDPSDIDKLADLIRRLAAAKASAERELATAIFALDASDDDVHCELKRLYHRAETAEAKLREARGLAIEQCAKIADDHDWKCRAERIASQKIAARIRALSNPE